MLAYHMVSTDSSTTAPYQRMKCVLLKEVSKLTQGRKSRKWTHQLTMEGQ